MNKRKFGIIGEKIAKGYLENKGYEILKLILYKVGEIDIISKRIIVLYFWGKTRSNLKYGTPAMSVNKVKRNI